MIVDTHCHLYMEAFDMDRESVIDRAVAAGVRYMVNVGIDATTNKACHQLALSRPGLFHTAGFHPHSAHLFDEGFFSEVTEFTRLTKPVAIGEVGLDYYKSEADPAIQKKVFARMIGLALSENLPLIVHSREALQDTLEVLKVEGNGKARGVIHCFSYDIEAAKAFYDLGFMTSFTCNVTYKNAVALARAVSQAPLDHIMLETDSPYLSPQIFRGKRNEPAHLRQLVDFISEKRGLSAEAIEQATTQNAIRFFGLPPHE